ncbi:hypothetical protein NONO_c73340 [Nocardia nova SH22a]|uniref:Uncharacterized protein n=1 Tax=Nocardia nova SH22a TaxID=1415166 RepID=W5TRT1_9NOCA|nr:hypothetical protein NONO_c73340 [Nocardia nova SH22a]
MLSSLSAAAADIPWATIGPVVGKIVIAIISVFL